MHSRVGAAAVPLHGYPNRAATGGGEVLGHLVQSRATQRDGDMIERSPVTARTPGQFNSEPLDIISCGHWATSSPC